MEFAFIFGNQYNCEFDDMAVMSRVVSLCMRRHLQLPQASSRVWMSILPRSDKTPLPSKKMSCAEIPTP